MKSKGRRGPHDVMWCVCGVAKFVSLEDAVDLAFDVLGEQMRVQVQVRTIWTEFA